MKMEDCSEKIGKKDKEKKKNANDPHRSVEAANWGPCEKEKEEK